MANMAKAVAPIAFEAFEEHVLYAMRVSRSLKVRLHKLLSSLAPSSLEATEILGELDK